MQANLQWIYHEWDKWLKTDRAKKIWPHGFKPEENLHTTHVSKLFAAHCIEALHAEIEAAENVG